MKNNYNQRLASCFTHKPSEYVFTHTKIGDFCACGHIIKTAYVVQHPTGHVLELGSECINNYAELNDVKVQVDAYIAKKKEEEKAHKEAEAVKEFQEALEKLDAIASRVRDAMKKNYVSRDLWFAVCRMKRPWEKMKTTKSKIAKVETAINELNKLIKFHNESGYGAAVEVA
jgi:hypothetical protein